VGSFFYMLIEYVTSASNPGTMPICICSPYHVSTTIVPTKFVA
jgi:hypothetical protein